MPPNTCSRCGRRVDPDRYWQRRPDGSLLCCSCEDISAAALRRERKGWGVAAAALATLAILNIAGHMCGCYSPPPKHGYEPWSGASPFVAPSWTNSLSPGAATNVEAFSNE